jgi:hypothetical protein
MMEVVANISEYCIFERSPCELNTMMEKDIMSREIMRMYVALVNCLSRDFMWVLSVRGRERRGSGGRRIWSA